MIDGQHLYPIRQAEQQNAVSQIKTEHKTYHHKTEKTQERTTHVFHHTNDILMMIGHMRYEPP